MMKLSEAKLCIDCEEIFSGNGNECPACGSLQWRWLGRWLPPLCGPSDPRSTVMPVSPNKTMKFFNYEKRAIG